MSEHPDYSAVPEVDAMDFVRASRSRALVHPKPKEHTKRQKRPAKSAGGTDSDAAPHLARTSSVQNRTILPPFPAPRAIPAA
eukprot:2451120-Rhodomonas_salina.1